MERANNINTSLFRLQKFQVKRPPPIASNLVPFSTKLLGAIRLTPIRGDLAHTNGRPLLCLMLLVLAPMLRFLI